MYMACICVDMRRQSSKYPVCNDTMRSRRTIRAMEDYHAFRAGAAYPKLPLFGTKPEPIYLDLVFIKRPLCRMGELPHESTHLSMTVFAFCNVRY